MHTRIPTFAPSAKNNPLPAVSPLVSTRLLLKLRGQFDEVMVYQVTRLFENIFCDAHTPTNRQEVYLSRHSLEWSERDVLTGFFDTSRF